LRASNDALQYCSFQARSLSLKGWGLIDLPLRATFSPAHPLARRDVPVARARASCFLFCIIKPSLPRESPDCPSLRASDEHRFIVRVLRARRMVWRLPSHPSQAARCASTGDHQAPSPLTPPLLPPAHAAQRPLSVHRDQPRPRGHLPPFVRSSEPPEDSPPAAGAESATQKLNR
jgi:hypothetical protein